MNKITNEDLSSAYKEVMGDYVYGKEYEILKEFLQKHPENIIPGDVAIKIALIDITNSTNLNKYKQKISLFELAQNICNIKDIDERLAKGDLTLVKEIANQSKIKLFSFATKYCCYHNTICYNKDDYSIYDNTLKKNLGNYINIKSYEIEKCRKNCDYEKYHTLIETILKRNNITLLGQRRKFDYFIWWNERKRLSLLHKQPRNKRI